MRGALLFSGGKDSIYSYIIAREKLNLDVQYLIFLKPSFPSPHELNSHIVYVLSKLLGRKLVRTTASDLSSVLTKLELDYLIAADIYVWDHLYWLEQICTKCGISLIEPLLCMDTYSIVEDFTRRGLSFMIIGVDKKLDKETAEKLLGLEVNHNNLDYFISLVDKANIDPAGESGEYHSIVTSLSHVGYRIEVCKYRKCDIGRYLTIVISYFNIKRMVI